MKTRVICLSKALSPQAAVEFTEDLRGDKDDFKYVFSGRTMRGRKGARIPKFYVVRIPQKGEQIIDAHEMHVEKKEILDSMPEIVH